MLESPRCSATCQASLTDTIRLRVVQLFHGFEGANDRWRYVEPTEVG